LGRQVIQCRDAWQEEVFAARRLDEGIDLDDPPQRLLADGEVAFRPDQRVGLVKQRREIPFKSQVCCTNSNWRAMSEFRQMNSSPRSAPSSW
jgi:hypothetical protein